MPIVQKVCSVRKASHFSFAHHGTQCFAVGSHTFVTQVSEYAEGASGSNGGWPLCSNILDPVRASVVCSGPSEIMQVLSWYTGSASEIATGADTVEGAAAPNSGEQAKWATGMPVCRVKNKFAFAEEDLVGG